MKQKIIGFTGRVGVGKTTIARMLSKHQWQSDISGRILERLYEILEMKAVVV